MAEFRQQEMSSEEIKEREKSNDLSLLDDFTGASLNLYFIQKSNQFPETLESGSEYPLMPETKSIIHDRDPGADNLLNSGNATTDYHWLLSPPHNSVPGNEMEDQKAPTSQNLKSNDDHSNPPRVENGTSTTVAPTPQASSNCIKSSGGSIRRSSPLRKRPSTGSRSATPTPRPTLPSTTKPSRSSTPTSRSTVAAMKPVPPTRSSSRSSTPTPRPSILAAPSKPTSRPSTSSITIASKSTSRSSTPTQRPVKTENTSRSTSVTKTQTPTLKNPTSSRGSSPSVKSRPLKNLPATETNSKEIPKRSSSTPSRRHVSNGRVRSSGNINDDVNPVLMGTKMVERVVNMRKLAPPRQDHDQNNKLSVSQDNSGFGRTLSKKSFDMAMRHLDIRRSMPGNMRAMITKVPASSVYSVRSEAVDTSSSGSSV